MALGEMWDYTCPHCKCEYEDIVSCDRDYKCPECHKISHEDYICRDCRQETSVTEGGEEYCPLCEEIEMMEE